MHNGSTSETHDSSGRVTAYFIWSYEIVTRQAVEGVVLFIAQVHDELVGQMLGLSSSWGGIATPDECTEECS